jgi:hypothetical protein
VLHQQLPPRRRAPVKADKEARAQRRRLRVLQAAGEAVAGTVTGKPTSGEAPAGAPEGAPTQKKEKKEKKPKPQKAYVQSQYLTVYTQLT